MSHGLVEGGYVGRRTAERGHRDEIGFFTWHERLSGAAHAGTTGARDRHMACHLDKIGHENTELRGWKRPCQAR